MAPGLLRLAGPGGLAQGPLAVGRSAANVSELPPVASFTFSPAAPSIGETVTFDASTSSDPDGNLTSYDWNFGDHGRVTLDTPLATHAFASAGTFDVKLTVTDNASRTDSVSVPVTVVDLPPSASFTVSPASPVALVTITFNASGSSDPDGSIVSYAWTFGDSSTGSGVTTTHAYGRAGSYSVTLTVTDDGGMTGTANQTVTVSDAPPTAAFTFSPASPMAGQPVAFDGSGSSDPDGTIASFSWAFGDGSTGSGAMPTHAYASAGTFTVTLTVTDDGGMTASVTHPVTVGDAPPTASFTFSPGSPVATETITFDASASSDVDGTITNYAWDFGDGGSASGPEALSSHAYDSPGTFTVTLTVTDNASLTDSVANPVTVVDLPPSASFTFTPAVPRAGQSVSFDGTASSDPDGTIASYAWAFGDGTTGSGATPTHAYATSGGYPVTLTVTDNGGKTGSVSHTVPVGDAPPTAAFTFAPTAPLALQEVAFDASGSSDSDGTVTSYSWTFGDGSGRTLTTPATSHAYAHAGTYSVTLTVTDNASLTSTVSHPITVGDAPPAASFSAAPGSPVAGQTVGFDGSASVDPDGTLTAYAWAFGDGTGVILAVPTTTHAYATAGPYSVTLTVTDDAGLTGSTTRVLQVAAGLPPVAAFTFSPAISTPNGSVDFDAGGSHATNPGAVLSSYAWTFGDGGTLGPTTDSVASHTYSRAGRFLVTLNVTDAFGYTNETSRTVFVDAPPVAAFTTSHIYGRVGRLLGFNGTLSTDSDGMIVEWAWDFGDRTFATGAVTSHAYAALGTFNVTLTVVDNNGFSGSIVRPILVVVPQNPVAVFTFGPSPVVVNESVTFDGSGSTDPDGAIVGYTWQFQDGAIQQGKVVTHAFAVVGPSWARLTVIDEDGNASENTKNLMVVTRPVAAFVFTPTVPRANETITFTAAGSSDLSSSLSSLNFTWSFGDGTFAKGYEAKKTYRSAGTYNATLTVINIHGLSTNVTHTIVVDAAPPAVRPPGPSTALFAIEVAAVVDVIGTVAVAAYLFRILRKSAKPTAESET